MSACGGAEEAQTPEQPEQPEQAEAAAAARTSPALVQPVADGEGCAVKNLETDEVLGRFDTACSRWTVTTNPKDPADVILTMQAGDGVEALRNGKPIPAFAKGAIDAVGFDASGAVVLYAGTSTDEDLKDDIAKGVSYIEVDGDRLEVPYDDNRMFGVMLCRYLTLDGDAWKPLAKPTLAELSEGMSGPLCARPDAAPELAPIHRPGMEEAIPGEATDIAEVPKALGAIPHNAENGWKLVDELDLAVGVMWFEGERLQEPVVRRDGEAWSALEGFGAERELSRAVQLFLKDDHLLVCTNDEAHLYDRKASYARVWHATGECPVFWPPQG